MQSAKLVETLKRILKARGITYAALAAQLQISEASIKRMFSQKNFTLKRLDEICHVTGIGFDELTATTEKEKLISQLTPEQEQRIVANTKLLLVAVCVLNQWTFEQIVSTYNISEAECVQLLAILDKIRFIKLLPNNRFKGLVTRTFSWLPDGPIQNLFKQHASSDYFRSRFDRPGEVMLVVNGMLSATSKNRLIGRLQQVAQEFSDMHKDDSRLPFEKRKAMSLLIAARPWELQLFTALRRAK